MTECTETNHPRLLICSCYVEAKDKEIERLRAALTDIASPIDGMGPSESDYKHMLKYCEDAAREALEGVGK